MTRRRVLTLVAIVVVGAAVAAWFTRSTRPAPTIPAGSFDVFNEIVPPLRMAPTLPTAPDLGEPATYIPPEQTLRIEISEYAGYAGLIVANGGLAPSENSIFFRDYGFKVELTLREGEGWEKVNQGRLAAVMTTADVAAVNASNLAAIVPLLVGYSRGANGLVVTRDVNYLSDLKGRIVATAQFTEAEFMVRYLAQRSGVAVAALAGIGARPHPGAINLVFTQDGFAACDALLNDLILNVGVISGCSAWEPKTSEVVARSGGAAHMLTTNRNLLIVADILVVNAGFAAANPDMLQGLVEGILRGNDLARTSAESQLYVIADAFGWSRTKAREELRNVHLANLPENVDFFAADDGEVGSFAHIYNAALAAYGPVLSESPPNRLSLLDMRPLQSLIDAKKFATQRASIERLRPVVRESEPFVGMPEPRVLTVPRTLPLKAEDPAR